MRSSPAAVALSTPPSDPPPASRTRLIPGFEDLDPRIAHALATQEIYSDEPEMDSDLHRTLMVLLIELLTRWWQGRNDVYVSGDLSVFYSLSQFDLKRPPTKSGLPRLARYRHRGPDVFVVFGAEPRMRKSWVVWQEGGKYPNVIIEILSRHTKNVDRGEKKQIYQDVFRTPEYFLFDPAKETLEGFRLEGGVYAPIAPGEDGRLCSEQMALHLGVHEGGLRLFTPSGEKLPTNAEAEQQAQQQAAQAQQQAAQAQQQAAQAQHQATQAQQREAKAQQLAAKAQQREAKAQQLAAKAQQREAKAQQREAKARQQNERLAAKLRELGIDPSALR